MKRILVTSVRDAERTAIHNYAQKHNIEIVTTDLDVDQAFDLFQGIDGVAIQQRGALKSQTYAALQDAGIKYLATRTAGYDMFDMNLAHKHGITITNVPAYSPRSVAEYALMQIFKLLRKDYEISARTARHNFSWDGLQGREIHRTTIGIIGAGRIGGTLAQLCHALGARVLAYDVFKRDDLKDVVTYVEFNELLEQADIISIHVDLNASSNYLLGKEQFNRMKKGACIVNAARGPVINTTELIDALKSGHIAAVALDTTEDEVEFFNADYSNKSIDHAPYLNNLLSMENVIVTPHIAFFTDIAVQNMVDTALDDIMLMLNGQPSPHIVS